MKKEEKQELQEIKRRMECLPEHIQRAVWWVVDHYDLACEICDGAPFTKEELKEYQIEAQAQGDSLLFVLLCLCEGLEG